MTEARQHNTEIRLSVGKVADKVEQLASKVWSLSAWICSLKSLNRTEILQVLRFFLHSQIDDLQRQGSLSAGVSSMSMETSMIMHNIQRIVQVRWFQLFWGPEVLPQLFLEHTLILLLHLLAYWDLLSGFKLCYTVFLGKWMFKERSLWEKLSHWGTKP